jgi:hypothetical protein
LSDFLGRSARKQNSPARLSSCVNRPLFVGRRVFGSAFRCVSTGSVLTPPSAIPPTRVTASAEPRQRPSLPLNLHFLLSSWATIPERQYDLRGWAMCVLDENPVFSAGLLNRFAGGTSEVFGQQENVEVVPANLDIEQMKAVSELVQIRQQPSIAYVARPVAIQNLSG